MKKFILVVSSAILFTGCATSPSEGSYGKMVAMSFVSPTLAREEAYKLGIAKRPIEQAKDICKQSGFREGTNQFFNCVSFTVNKIQDRIAESDNTNRIIRAQEHANFMNNLSSPPAVNTVNNGYRNYDCRARIGGRVECTGY